MEHVYKKNKIPFYGATFLDFNKTAERDVQIAKQLANVFSIKLRVFNLPPPKGKDFLKLLRMKNGLNYIGMSYILPFFDLIRETYGPRVIYFTGDGGDKLLPDIRPTEKIMI